jgi:hydrogenase maturation protease
VGPAVAEAIERLGLEGVRAEAGYQLSIEDAALAAECERVLFVDAALEGPAPFRVRRLAPSAAVRFTSHRVDPESILAICEDAFRARPAAWLIAVRGYGFEIAGEPTEGARANQAAALEYIKTLIAEWKGKTMAVETAKTILIIDDDPDIRAAMRVVLESSGFIVGEAADGEEGLKVANRIRPDAILLDLMMETVDAGSKVSVQLKESGYAGPIYLLSAAGDSVRYNIDARDLGLAGIFQKPIDHAVLLKTLRKKLKLD